MSVVFSKVLKNVIRKLLLQKIKVVNSLIYFLTRVLDDTRFMSNKKNKVVKRNVLFAHTII